MVTWTFKDASGRRGGVAGFKEASLTINAKVR
jgi:hypothetical protein